VSPVPSLASNDPAIVAPFFVLVCLWVSLSIGRRLLRLLAAGASEASPGERGAIAIALGAGALQFVPFFLGTVGLLNVAAIRIAFWLIAVISLVDVPVVIRRVQAIRSRQSRPPAWAIAWMLALVPALFVILLVALTPTLDPDGLTYHLTAPKRWLSTGYLTYLPTYLPTNGPMGVEMLFALAMANGGDIAAKLVHFALGLVGGVALYYLGARLYGPIAGALSVTLYLVGPTGLGTLLGLAYVEGATALMIIAATLAWLVWLNTRDTAWLRCAFILAGFSVTFKLTAALFPVTLAALTVVAILNTASERHEPVLPQLTRLLWLVPFVAVPVIPWFVRSAIVTGNPVFPLFAKLIPSYELSGSMVASYEEFNRYWNWGTGFSVNWPLAMRKRILATAAILTLVVGGVAITRVRSRFGRQIAAVILAMTLVQLITAGLYVRYWVPTLGVLQLFVLGLFRPILAMRAAKVALVVITVACSLLQARRAISSVGRDLGGLAKTAFGFADRRAFLLQHMPLFPIYEYANQTLPPAAGVLLNGYCGGFYLDRSTYCFDFPQEAVRSTTWNEFLSDVRRLGITHVIAIRTLADGVLPAPNPLSSAYAVHEGRNHEQVARLLKAAGRLRVAAADQGLYEIDFAALR
jgi:hypothetical protein